MVQPRERCGLLTYVCIWQRCDIARGISVSDTFDFLIDIVPREYMHIKSKVRPPVYEHQTSHNLEYTLDISPLHENTAPVTYSEGRYGHKSVCPQPLYGLGSTHAFT